MRRVWRGQQIDGVGNWPVFPQADFVEELVVSRV
jgi:hypothetical protein